MPDLLRPPPPRSWRDVLADAWASFRGAPGAVAGAAAAVVAVAVLVGVGLHRPAPRPVELDLPRADAGAGAGASTTSTTSTPAGASPAGGPASGPGNGDVVVHVAGAVVHPGIYRLPAGARVTDAVAAAGGLAGEADVDRLNLAAVVVDGERVGVPFVGRELPAPVNASPPPPPAPGAGGAATSAPVDLNAATLEQLESLPGVGPATAQAILDHRQQHGRFRSVTQLLEVRGIGEAKLAAIRPRVKV